MQSIGLNTKESASGNERSIDNLDIAFLALGANDALTKLDQVAYNKLANGYGQTGLIGEVIECAGLLAEAYAAVADVWDGVWAYDVAEALGEWFIVQWVANGNRPDEAAVRGEIRRLVSSGVVAEAAA